MLIGKALRYHCKSCSHSFEKYRNVENFHDPLPCEKCNNTIGPDDIKQSRSSLAKNYNVIGAKVTHAEYNPGLGSVVKNKHHKLDLMKQKGVVEVGNDYGSGEKQQREFERKKQDELDGRWKKASRELGLRDE